MKILVISNMYPNIKNPSYGVFVQRFCNQLESENIMYDKVVMFKEVNKIKKIYAYIIFYLKVFFKCLSFDYDYIYIHYASFSSLPVLIANKIKKTPIITNVHGSDVVPEKSIQVKMQCITQKILYGSEKIVVPSQYFESLIKEKYNIHSSKIIIYPSSGINSNIFFRYNHELIKKIKDRHGIAEDDFVIGFVGRLVKNKGWETFINGVELYYKNYKDTRLKVVVVGSGPDDDLFAFRMQNSPLKSNLIKFDLLNEKDLADIYNCLDILVFPSEREGESLGLVALEALGCGVPVISTNYAAPKYFIIDEYNGYKFELGNHQQLSEIINKYRKLDFKAKNELSNNCITVANGFLSENILESFKNIFY